MDDTPQVVHASRGLQGLNADAYVRRKFGLQLQAIASALNELGQSFGGAAVTQRHWIERGEKTSADAPAFITAGLDVATDRMEVQVQGWGADDSRSPRDEHIDRFVKRRRALSDELFGRGEDFAEEQKCVRDLRLLGCAFMRDGKHIEPYGVTLQPIQSNRVDPMRSALEGLMDAVGEPPAPNCSCHLSPPCGDCVEYGGLREAWAAATSALADQGGA